MLIHQTSLCKFLILAILLACYHVNRLMNLEENLVHLPVYKVAGYENWRRALRLFSAAIAHYLVQRCYSCSGPKML